MKLGDTVTWESQSGGYSKKKTGKIVVVISPNVDPGDVGARFPDELWLKNPGMPRSHESYLIHIPTPSGRGRGKLYWPVVSLLKLAKK